MSEEEVRKLRDNIYGPCSDSNWEQCSKPFVDTKTGYHGGWLREENIKWLKDNQPKNKI